MESNHFYATHLDNDDDVILLLGITSILQFDFDEASEIYFHTTRNIDHLINRFNWKKKPESGVREYLASEKILKLKDGQLEIHTADSVNYVPKHLLKIQHISPEVLISQAWVIAKVIHEKKFSENPPSKKIAFVYTNEVKEWISLLEANEALIAKWYRQRDAETELVLVDLTKGVQADIVGKTAFACDQVVIAKITLSTSQFIKSIRSINPDIRLIIHAFESPSVFFANTYLAGLKDFLYESDLWLMSCKADLELAKLSWKKINAEVFPLKSPDLFLNTEATSEMRNVIYVGRISEQKNLHEAIVAIALIADEMRSSQRKFKIYGYEDFLGLPHHRIPSLGYLEMLYKLVSRLGLSDIVEFHPALPQDKIIDVLKEGVFLSPSFHSDENFGLVAFRALNQGIPVILSDWGGHRDFGSAFTNVNVFSLHQSAKTPHLNPFELADLLLKVWSKNTPQKRKVPWKKVSSSEENSRALMKLSDVKIGVEKRIENSYPWAQRRWPLYGKIFKSFADNNYNVANICYGALPSKKRPPQAGSLVSPFVKVSSKEIKILDCTTGVLKYPRRDDSRNIQLKQLGNESLIALSRPEFEWLQENGHVYSRGTE
jgi:glycosyltransferase involved in cell wall biosynthesis